MEPAGIEPLVRSHILGSPSMGAELERICKEPGDCALPYALHFSSALSLFTEVREHAKTNRLSPSSPLLLLLPLHLIHLQQFILPWRRDQFIIQHSPSINTVYYFSRLFHR